MVAVGLSEELVMLEVKLVGLQMEDTTLGEADEKPNEKEL